MPPTAAPQIKRRPNRRRRRRAPRMEEEAPAEPTLAIIKTAITDLMVKIVRELAHPNLNVNRIRKELSQDIDRIFEATRNPRHSDADDSDSEEEPPTRRPVRRTH